MGTISKSIGSCPLCGRDVVDRGNRYACGGESGTKGLPFGEYLRSHCFFGLYKDCLRHVGKSHISPEEMSVLLTGKSILLTGLCKKDGNFFDTHGILTQRMGRWGIKFVRASQHSGLVRRLVREQRAKAK